MYITHPRFRDVAMEVVKISRYKPGFVDLRFYWIYPQLRGHKNVRIFDGTEKIRMPEEKYREFVSLQSDQ